jgi:hypothetical protein
MAKPKDRGEGSPPERPERPRLGNPDADPVKIHREYVERRLGGQTLATPEQYERATEQWQRLPGAVSRPPTAAPDAKPAEPERGEEEPPAGETGKD